jgi:acetoin utilization protein AcuC
MEIPHFYYHPRMLSYDFGPRHPLKPERLRRTIALLSSFGVTMLDPGEGDPDDVLRVHDEDYVRAVQNPDAFDREELAMFGIGTTDNPLFPGMFEAALTYVAGSAQAARDVSDGAKLAFNISGGLHHARRSRASGFCVFNDCAIAISILRERFQRVAYVDIDVHHGCGVQWIFYEDPTVMTCSIHQDGRSLYPGSGFADETSIQNTAVNMPVRPGTSGDVWLGMFREGILPALERFRPEALVLQLGTDSHSGDPLARVENSIQEWLAAVLDLRDLRLPTVALGGGGYHIDFVPRMWTAAILTLAGHEVPERVPEPFASEWKTPFFLDPEPLTPRGVGGAVP